MMKGSAMSNDDFIRRQAQINLSLNPNVTHIQSYQADIHTAQTYNNELDRLRREDEERARQ